jgi:hypothetical protein
MYDSPDGNRLVRIETRLAKLQEHLGLSTRIPREVVMASPFNDESDPDFRLMRIETRIFQMLEALHINPRTGKPL